ncbi:MAG: translational machinery protein [Deltaproteobacteria bacterium]|nr:translational machinery protein [Deltaproteobacteria bacterium]
MALHTVIWIDLQARIFDFDAEGVHEVDIGAPHRHVRSRAAVSGRKEDSSGFFHDVAEKLNADHELLITGPPTRSSGLIKHIHAHHAALVPTSWASRPSITPTDGQIVAYARKCFRAADRMR